MYAIQIGQTAEGERQALIFQQLLGPNALNASIWVKRDGWKKDEFIRPTLAQVPDFLKDPSKFRSEKPVSRPDMLARLSQEQLDWVDYVVRYYVGGTKIYLKPACKITEAEAIRMQVDLQLDPETLNNNAFSLDF